MKYYYGNSYKEAVSNNPVEIPNTKILEAYKENYNVVIPVEEEASYYIVSKRVNANEAVTDEYTDFDDARSDFVYLVNKCKNDFEYIILQKHIYEGDIVIDEYSK